MDNYEEKYKAALGWMQSLYGGLHGTTKEEAEKYFPELKESDGEKIRKKVIEVLKLNIKGAESQMQASRGVDRCFEIYACTKVIAWLEKQREKQHIWTDNDRVMAFTLLRDVDKMTYISSEGKNARLQWLNSLEEKFNKSLDAAKVIEWLECKAFQGWAEPIDIRPIIRKFKKDFHIEPPKKGGEQ